jgi:hypothetical protein
VTSCVTNQVMFGIHRSLNVVTDDPGASGTGGHGAGIWIGERDLLIGNLAHLLAEVLEALYLRPDHLDILLQMLHSGFGNGARVSIRPIQVR